MASAIRTIRVRFDGTAKGLIAAAAQAGIAIEGFEKQAKKSAAALPASVGGGLVEALGSLPSVLKGAAIVAAAGIGVVMAPALASAIISGVLLAVGGGVLAAGIVGAAKSPKVVKAWQKFGRQATVVFERFSKPFIAPLASAASYFAKALARAEPTIKRIGEAIAPWVIQLASATAIFGERLMPGILAAATAAGPFIDILSVNLPGIADSISAFFGAISAGSPAAQVFFSRFLGWVQNILPKLGGFITWLSDLGVKMDAFAKGPEFTALKDALTTLKDDTLAGVKTGFDNIKVSIDTNSETWRQLGEDINTVIRALGPAVKWFAGLVGESIGAAIDWFASLYRAVKKVVDIVDALIRGYSRLPGNLSGGNTHVEFGNLPGRAEGGRVGAHRSYLVGEGGEPEILTMGAQSGYVTPLSKVDGGSAAGAGGDIVLHDHIDLGEGIEVVFQRKISRHDRRIRRQVTAMAGA